MDHQVLIGLAAIVVLGVTSQWVAWRLRLPSILLLLATGIVAGPILGLIDPAGLFGDLLLPIVSLSVAVVLYDGGLSLKVRELRAVRGVFFRLATVGVLISWILISLAAYYLLDFEASLAILLGAILVVTGPTVIGPLLRHLRLGGNVGALLKWEGIVVDPIGAMLAVMVFALVRGGEMDETAGRVALDFVLTFVAGLAVGCLGAGVLIVSLRRYWIPDSLQNSVSLMLVVATHTAANMMQPEAGLLAVTIMGIALANQRWVAIKHLVEFKENLTVLLLSGLFIVLAARLSMTDLTSVGFESLLFLAVLVFVVRPASVLASTLGSNLSWSERIMLSWMAPRGIVAVAVTSVFALEMEAIGYARAAEMAPVTFVVVFGTVLLYGLTAPLAVQRLGLARPNPQGVLFVGAQPWARETALALQAEGCPVLCVDTNWVNISQARMAGLPCYFGSILSDDALNEIDYSQFGRMLALTSNNEVNSLACLRYIEMFGRREVYQLPFGQPADGRHEAVPLEQRGRLLFGKDLNYEKLEELFFQSPEIKKTRLTPEFDFKAFKAMHGQSIVLLFLLKPDGRFVVYTADDPPQPEVGHVIFSLSAPAPERHDRPLSAALAEPSESSPAT